MSGRDEYESFFEHLRQDMKPTSAISRKWIGYLFHLTDVHNAASILTSGSLFNRHVAQSLGHMRHDNAESSIIASTNKDILEYVRLYFRPRTPTFFHNEGFKSRTQLATDPYSAHCPVPIALAFNAAQVLSLPGVRFSDRNLASRSNKTVVERTLSGIRNLQALPFDAIYHSGTLYADDPGKPRIIQHRNAEVIVPDKLHLAGNLAAIRSRSDAELETLRTLLPPGVWNAFRPLSGVNSDGSLFFATHYFIEHVSVQDGSIIIRVHHDPGNHDDFTARFKVEYDGDEAPVKEFVLQVKTDMGPTLRIGSNLIDTTQVGVTISIYLDDHLAYKGKHWLNEDPLISPF